MKQAPMVLVMILLAWLSSASAQETEPEDPPSMEFLEFLGMLEVEDSEWLGDPLMLLTMQGLDDEHGEGKEEGDAQD